MRILRIFGIVVAVHLAAFMFVFAIPGCRSTTRHSPNRPNPSDTLAAPTPTRSLYADTSPISGGSLEPTPTPVSAIIFPGNPAARSNPTRPGTPVAEALSAPPVTDVVPAKTYKVVSKDSLWTVAKRHGLTEADLAAANNLRSGSPLKVGQKLIIPAKQLPPAIDSSALSAQSFTYKVQAGETLAQIAKRAGVSTAEIKALNHLSSESVYAGQALVLPASPASAARSASEPVETPKVAASKPLKAGAIRHTVKPGESLGAIAKKYGIPLREIATANHISNPANLRAGLELIIPAPKTAPAAATTPTTPTTTTPVKTETPAVESPFISPVGPSNDSSPISAPAVEANPVSVPADNGFISPSKE